MVDVGKEEVFKSWIINLTSNQALIKEKDKLYLEVIKK